MRPSRPHPVRSFRAVSKLRKPKSLYGMRSFPALGEYDDFDGGLGKFKFKNVVKSVTKAATQTAKVAVKPAALVAGSTLQAVGLRSAADKLGKNLGLTAAERKIAKVGGTAIDVGAVVVGGIAVAPYAAAAATAAGHGLVAAGSGLFGAAKGLLPKAAGLLSSLIKKQTTPAGSSSETAAAPGEAPAVPGWLGGLIPSTPPADNAVTAPAGSPPAGGASASAPESESSAAAPADGTAPVEAGIMGGFLGNPKLMILGAAVSLFFIAKKHKRSGRKHR